MMKKYNIYDLKVLKIVKNDITQYFICKHNELTNTYVEILTNKKIKINNESYIEPLGDYYSVLEQCNYQTGKPLMLDKKMILEKYISINVNLNLNENKKHIVSKILSK